MDTLLQANIFFFITSIAIVVVTIALVAALVLFIQVLQDARYVSRRVREETDRLLSDVEDVRRFVKKEGKRAIDLKGLIDGAIGTFFPRRKSRRRKKSEGAE